MVFKQKKRISPSEGNLPWPIKLGVSQAIGGMGPHFMAMKRKGWSWGFEPCCGMECQIWNPNVGVKRRLVFWCTKIRSEPKHGKCFLWPQIGTDRSSTFQQRDLFGARAMDRKRKDHDGASWLYDSYSRKTNQHGYKHPAKRNNNHHVFFLKEKTVGI